MKDKIAKLPQWAQEHIVSLERERENAISALREWVDAQTPSPISIGEYESLGEQAGPSRFTRYVQTRRVRFEWLGVGLDVTLRDDGLALQWASIPATRDVCMQPRSYQHVYLLAKEQMR